MDNKKSEIVWEPHGKVCLKCGGQNPDGHDICGGCGEKANELEENEMTEEQYAVHKMIERKLK